MTAAADRTRHRLLFLVVALAFAALALLRPVDHDESQYVAAAVLTAAGRLPYADYAYLQTPLQPFAFAPVAWLAGGWTWPALRILNALLGAVAVTGVHRGARDIGATGRQAAAAALLFAGCDVLLFSVGVARNDALPVACFAWAVALIVDERPSPWRAVATGLLLALAASAKISYAVPAAAFGGWALMHHRDRRPLMVVAGAMPAILFVAWTAWLAPAAFLFGTTEFPVHAPAQFYADRPWKLSIAAKAVDTAKFLALGAGLPAIIIAARYALTKRPTALDIVLLAAIVSALLPSPTWRQYLLPILPPLFVRLALCWSRRPASQRQRWAIGIFATAGVGGAVASVLAPGSLGLLPAMRQAIAAKRAMDGLAITGPVVTLSPQLLPATGRLPDVRFAAGPFYYRSHGLLPADAERKLHLVSRDDPLALADGEVALIGGENTATSGDPALDAALARAVRGRRVPIPGTDLTLLVRDAGRQATASERDARAQPYRARP